MKRETPKQKNNGKTPHRAVPVSLLDRKGQSLKFLCAKFVPREKQRYEKLFEQEREETIMKEDGYQSLLLADGFTQKPYNVRFVRPMGLFQGGSCNTS